MNDLDFKKMVNKGVERTIEQGKPCLEKNGRCSYGIGYIRCPIGHMMTDEDHLKYKDSDQPVGDLIADGWMPGISGYQKNILLSVQGAHDLSCDNNDFVNEFKSRISDLKLDELKG